jgi:hypothetical protein
MSFVIPCALSAVTTDAIRDGPAELLNHSYTTFEKWYMSEGSKIDVIDYIYNDRFVAMISLSPLQICTIRDEIP